MSELVPQKFSYSNSLCVASACHPSGSWMDGREKDCWIVIHWREHEQVVADASDCHVKMSCSAACNQQEKLVSNTCLETLSSWLWSLEAKGQRQRQLTRALDPSTVHHVPYCQTLPKVCQADEPSGLACRCLRPCAWSSSARCSCRRWNSSTSTAPLS